MLDPVQQTPRSTPAYSVCLAATSTLAASHRSIYSLSSTGSGRVNARDAVRYIASGI